MIIISFNGLGDHISNQYVPVYLDQGLPLFGIHKQPSGLHSCKPNVPGHPLSCKDQAFYFQRPLS
jgi:hypothetical protein